MRRPNLCGGTKNTPSPCFAFLLLASIPFGVSSVPSSSSREQLRFFDELRGTSPDIVHFSRTKTGSSVVEVGLSAEGVNNDTAGSRDGTDLPVYRLCHLTSLLPLTHGDGRPNGHMGGLFTNGAALLAVNHWNERNDVVVPELGTDEILRNCNVKFTMESQDTQGSPIAACSTLIQDVLSRNHSIRTPMPIALVGAMSSAVSGALSVTASTNSLPVISPISQSTMLNNKDIYGLFGRTNPGSAGDALAAVSYLRQVLNVTHCGVLFVRDAYGSAYHSEFIRAAFDLDPPMRILSASYDNDRDAESSIYNALGQFDNTGFNYFYGIIQAGSFDEFVKAARKRAVIGRGRSWMFSYDVILEDYVTKDKELAQAINGITYLSFDFQHDQFEEEWKSMEQDELLKEDYLSHQPKGLDLSSFVFPSSPSSWEYMTYDAVMALGFAACESPDYFFDGASLFRAFTKVSFLGASGKVQFDESSGSRNPNDIAYKVGNIVASKPGEGGSVSFFVRDVARQMRVGNSNDDSALKWITVNATVYAGGGAVAPPILPPLEITNSIGMGIICFGLALSAFCMSTSVMWGVWTIINRNTRVVSSSQPRFLLMLCVGTFVAASSIVPPSLQVFGVSQGFLDISCMAGPWLMCLGWVVTFSAIFSKTLRVYKLIKLSHSFQRIKTKPKDFLLPFVLLFTFTVFVLISWTVVAPLKWRHTALISSVDEFGRSNNFYARCAPEPGKAIWPFLLLLFVLGASCLLYSVYVTYQARHIPIEYNETHYISICVISILQAFLVGVPVWVIVRNSPQASYVLGAILVTAFCAAVLLPIFVPKERARRTRKETQELKSLIKEEKNIYVGLLTKNQLLKDEKERILQLQRRPSQTQTQEMGRPPLCYIGHIMQMFVSSLTTDTNDGNSSASC